MTKCKHNDTKSIYKGSSTIWCEDCGSIHDGWNMCWQAPKQQELEIVICSAIRLPTGKIIRGHRHGDCIRTAREFVNWNGGIEPNDERWDASMSRDQGFITSKNRYVWRDEALKLQLKAGIASACPSGYREEELYSEDLY
jgi:hypothetical protein